MQAGKLDRRIQFQRYVNTDDGFQSVKQWSDHGSPIWASKRDVSDGERLRAGEVSAVIGTRWVVKSSEFTRAITPKDAIRYGSLVFSIFGIKELGRNDFLEITTGAEVSNGNS